MEYMQCTHSTFAKPNTTQHNTTLNSTICLQVALVKCGKVLEILKSFANFESTNLTILSLSLLIPECIIFKIKAQGHCCQGDYDGRGQRTASPMLTAIMSGHSSPQA